MNALKFLTEFSTTIRIDGTETSGIVSHLPTICAEKLQKVVSRDLKVTPKLITFHGGASTTARPRVRWVTNWNLLSPIEYGEIRIQTDSLSSALDYRIEYGRPIKYATFGLSVMALALGCLLFYATGEWWNSFLSVLFFSFCWWALSVIGLLILNIRFYWFIKSCIRGAKLVADQALKSPGHQWPG